MRKRKGRRRLWIGQAVLCCLLSGCGIRDAAYVVAPVETFAGQMEEEAVETAEGQVEEEISSPERREICVYVCGAVVNPGVVRLPEDSRAEDALLAAGGFSEEARTDYVNLAARVSDGEKLYIPDRQEAEALLSSADAQASGLVNINTADAALLCTLPGIGESRARDIIAYREENGAFQSAEDIMKVSGIKESTYEKLSSRITIN